jgi:hypothetical protein
MIMFVQSVRRLMKRFQEVGFLVGLKLMQFAAILGFWWELAASTRELCHSL